MDRQLGSVVPDDRYGLDEFSSYAPARGRAECRRPDRRSPSRVASRARCRRGQSRACVPTAAQYPLRRPRRLLAWLMLVAVFWDGSRAAQFALSFLVVAVVAPIVEELTFRGLGFGLLSKYGVRVALVGTAVLFGLVHGFLVALPLFVI